MEVIQFTRVQRVQIHDQIPGHAVQTPDGKLQTTSEEQEQQQQPMEPHDSGTRQITS